MFSRQDLGKGTAHPLLWVFGPLILGALVITGLGIIARASQGFPDIELAEEIRLAATEGDPLLAEVTPFAWDRVCVVPPRATKADVDALIGRDWGVVGGDAAPSRRMLFVFLNDGEVVRHFFLETGAIPGPAPGGDCRSPDDERTRL